MTTPLELISTHDTDCANNNDKICSPPEVIKEIQVQLKLPPNEATKEEVIEKAKEVMHCDNEICLYKKLPIKKNVDEVFKPKGPKNNTTWLSNDDIDKTLQQWSDQFADFFPCKFAMMDFSKYDSQLRRVDILGVKNGEEAFVQYFNNKNVKRPCNKFACILNTDFHNGNGIHWVALFVDMSSPIWTIEYFNSAGSPPTKEITEWVETNKRKLKKENDTMFINVTNVEHQKSNTECGVYSLFYVRCRLEGVSYEEFTVPDKRISDKYMIEFRKHLFRN